MVKPYKMARAYQLKGHIYIQGYNITSEGAWWLDGSIFIILATDFLKIGKDLLTCLNGSGKIIPHPSIEELRTINNNSPMVRLTEMKTWAQLERKARSLNIEAYMPENKIKILPEKHVGRGAAITLDDLAITTDLDPQHIGEAVLKAFELCE